MDDGEIDFSNQEMFSNSNIDLPSSCSMDSFFDEILKDTHACTHTHTCNPPGPDYSHTHTCLHIHTKFVPGSNEDKVSADESAESAENKSKKQSTGGNREAVRKYRQKKKAQTASLEDEVARLKAENQELLRSLRDQSALEAEIVRLKCLLVDIRGRLDGEIGSFPYQKPASTGGDLYPNMGNQNLPGAYVMNPCNFHCEDQVQCLYPGVQQGNSGEIATVVNGHGFSGCDFENLQCIENRNVGSAVNDGAPPTKPPAANKRKGKRATAG